MLIVACKFIRLFEKAYDNNTLSSHLTRFSHVSSVSFPCFDWCSHLAWALPRLPNKKDTVFRCLYLSSKKSAYNKKSLLWCIEYGHLSASRNILMEILRISCFTVWKHTASREWTSGSCTLPGLPSKYFRPHWVNRRRFQPACCFTAGKSDARRNLLQPVTEFTSVQRMQTKLTPISSKGCVLIKILATIIMEILRISETDDL